MATRVVVETVCDGPHGDESLLAEGEFYQVELRVGRKRTVRKQFCLYCARDLAPYLGLDVPPAEAPEGPAEAPFDTSGTEKPSRSAQRALSRMMREWAVAEGLMSSSSRGRIPGTVQEAYAAHHETPRRGKRGA